MRLSPGGLPCVMPSDASCRTGPINLALAIILAWIAAVLILPRIVALLIRTLLRIEQRQRKEPPG